MGRRLLRADAAPNLGARELRILSRRLSYQQLGARIGRTDRVVWSWLSGRRTPCSASRALLEEKLGIDAGLWEQTT